MDPKDRSKPAMEPSSATSSTPDADQTEQRKADHIRINVEEDVSFKKLDSGLDSYFFMHQALPELDFAKIITTTHFLGKSLKTPLMISSMTGGTAEAYRINRILASAAQETGMAMGLGSVRAAIEDPEIAYTYQVRDVAPDVLLLANLGAVQLNYGYGLEQCMRAVEICEADGLILHFNALQEAVQPEGDSDFSGLLDKVEKICRGLPVPVIAKEVGWGFAQDTARQLASAGVSAIDVAGAGGTSWSQVEMYRAPTPRHARIAGAFIDWGIPTAFSIQYCRSAAPSLPIIASGGIRNGIDVAKCIALGAQIAGLAGDFLRAAVQNGVEGVIDTAGALTDELRVTMFGSGAADISSLAETPLYDHF
ncbi:MAG: type 2 isopentenyl-diphosphate Delta-isomerase [Candidatus Promineifilaceae bacterium]